MNDSNMLNLASQNAKLCRCCLAREKGSVRLEDFTDGIRNMFFSINGIELSWEKTVSSKICRGCIDNLSMSYQFKKRCLEANEALQSTIQTTSKVESERRMDNDLANETVANITNVFNELLEKFDNLAKICQSCLSFKKPLESINLHLKNHEYDLALNQNLEFSRSASECYSMNFDGQIKIDSQFLKSESDLEPVMQDELSVITVNCNQTRKLSQIDHRKTRSKTKFDNIDFSTEKKREDDRNNENVIHTNDEANKHDIKPPDDAGFKHYCHRCNGGFKYLKKLTEHMNIEHGTALEFKCELCNKILVSTQGYKVHMMAHSGSRNFNCSICSKSFILEAQLKYHERSHTEEKKYTCESCGKKFRSFTHLKIHHTTHETETPHVCQTCGKGFKTQFKLNQHAKRCSGQKNCVCEECGKHFVTVGDLHIHVRTHTKEKPYPCDVCAKHFKTHSHRADHMRTHTGTRPYKCPHCPKAFTTNGTLKGHLRIHSGELPYSCSVCRRPFRQRASMRTHMKVHNLVSADVKDPSQLEGS